ncbi:MAG: hypothetical protein WD081_01905 [Gammaproteobacteria bacterium]
MSDSHYDVSEAAEKIRSMSKDDWNKVASYAFTLATRMNGCEFGDLMNEAVLRTIEGTRSWKRGMEPSAHFFGVMKSILYSYRKAAQFEATSLQQLSAEFDDEAHDITPTSNEASLHDLVVEIKHRANLNDIEIAVLDALAAGDDIPSLLKSLSISKAQYQQILSSLTDKIDHLDHLQ